MLKKLSRIFNSTEEDMMGYQKTMNLSGSDVTFTNNKKESIHRWYPYIEGFSQGFVEAIIKEYDLDALVYDPFNGSGTTTLTCAFNGYRSIGTEVNPLMRFVANTKVNVVRSIINNNKIDKFRIEIDNYVKETNKRLSSDIDYTIYINSLYFTYDFFSEDNIKTIAKIKKYYSLIRDDDIRDLFKLSLVGILVECSNMIRSVDLRRRKGSELKRIPNDMNSRYIDQLLKILNDIKSVKDISLIEMKLIGDNAKKRYVEYENKVDVIITSPPYVNGTNYFRNTKLELWILDFISDEKDLKELRTNAITAGINNVSKSIDSHTELEFVEKYARALDDVAKDKRIPKLVRAYFSDINTTFINFYRLLKDRGRVYFDIGDSQYYGVHIPVDKLISKIAKSNGFLEISNEVIRNRKSKNGMLLSQRVIIFEKGMNTK
jgi:DNA modification methylase